MSRILAWFRAHRITTWSLRVVLVLWGIHECLNWAAEREWRRYCAAARARGVKLTLAEFAPPEIPDAENFAALPMFKAALAATMVPTPNPFELPKSSSGSLPSGGNVIKGTPIDWTAWQQYFNSAGLIVETTDNPIADVLRALDHYQPTIDEWRGWKQRPRCRFPLNLKVDPTIMRFPPFGIMQGAAQICGWRMHAHLAQRDSSAALEDFRDVFQSYRALRDEPTLISGLVRLAAIGVVNARIGNGLAERVWTEPDLRALEAEMATVSILEDYQRALSSERAFANAAFDHHFWAASRLKRATYYSANRNVAAMNVLPRLSYWDIFVGFALSKHQIRDNQLRQNRFFDELLARIGDDERSIDLDRATPSAPNAKENIVEQWHYVIFNSTRMSFDVVEQKYVRTAAQFNQTRLAIALERFHLARGVFPETLDALVPGFLAAPLLDPCSGKPMIYRRAKTDSFLLYSVGEDRKDDGGAVDPRKPESIQSDVIWLYAPP